MEEEAGAVVEPADDGLREEEDDNVEDALEGDEQETEESGDVFVGRQAADEGDAGHGRSPPAGGGGRDGGGDGGVCTCFAFTSLHRPSRSTVSGGLGPRTALHARFFPTLAKRPYHRSDTVLKVEIESVHCVSRQPHSLLVVGHLPTWPAAANAVLH